MNFLKKVIGLSMAMVMAFGGFAANAVRFINETTEEFVDVKWYFSNQYKVQSATLEIDPIRGVNSWKIRRKIVYLSESLGLESYALVRYYKILDFIRCVPELRDFFNNNKYEEELEFINDNESITTYWILEEDDMWNYKREVIVFHHYLNNLRLKKWINYYINKLIFK